MKLLRTLPALLLAVLLLAPAASLFAADWPPVDPQELAMKDDPSNPGAPAIILYREEFTDDSQGRSAVENSAYGTHIGNSVNEYVRIKVLTEAGKKWADVNVPYYARVEDIDQIKGRTIEPDGTIKEFTGQVFDKVWKKKGTTDQRVKTFTLPDVRVGSILEYRYRKVLSSDWYSYYVNVVYDPAWIVQSDLFTRKAHFELNPARGAFVRYNWFLPANIKPEKKGERVELDMENVPAFQQEEFIPPEDSLKMRVEFFYMDRDPGPDFWKDTGKDFYKSAEAFIGKHKAIAAEAERVAPPQDSSETRLRKLYARAQQVRNLSFEHQKTEQEVQRAKQKVNDNAEDLMKRGYGYHNQINRLMVALARAAGFSAALIRVQERDKGFFAPTVYDPDQLSRELVVVQTNGRTYFLDPGTPRCPFGLLPWQDSAVQGLLLTKDGGTFARTPEPRPEDGVLQRTAEVQLAGDGSLTGKITFSWQGQQALERRLDGLEEDDAGRRKMIEDDIRKYLPEGAVLKLTSVQGWDNTEGPLTAEATVDLPNYATSAGRRLLLALGLFQAREQNPFAPQSRKNPIYFHYPLESTDDVTFKLPAGVQIETLPPSRDMDKKAAIYQVTRSSSPGSIHIERRFVMAAFYLDSKYYPVLRGFYGLMGVGDAEQAVLQVGGTSAQK
jgi:hypothetical protein